MFGWEPRRENDQKQGIYCYTRLEIWTNHRSFSSHKTDIGQFTYNENAIGQKQKEREANDGMKGNSRNMSKASGISTANIHGKMTKNSGRVRSSNAITSDNNQKNMEDPHQ